MRFLIYSVLGFVLLCTSCAGTNKRLRNNKQPVSEQVVSNVEEKKSSETLSPIKEVEEKLIPIAEVMPNPHRYFVIIGSFRDPENAKKHQDQIFREGFSSEILKNEDGLYRVSVLATDEIDFARDDIRRIRSVFPKYFDTWLLIQKK